MIPKNPEDLTPREKVVIGIETLKNFFDSINGPNDIYKQILLEELMRILIEESNESVHLPNRS